MHVCKGFFSYQCLCNNGVEVSELTESSKTGAMDFWELSHRCPEFNLGPHRSSALNP